ncbi:MAG: hypothetical protein HS101_07900 [Planctomycetia bacterium]|nr:hypothetical protein [Planctomycetia bacterium]
MGKFKNDENVDRPSLLDVFENFLGTNIETVSRSAIAKLASSQLDDLVDAIDYYLRNANTQAFPADTVMLDMLTNPIIAAHDPTVPQTTRAVKQVALGHREVVIPMGDVGVDYRCARNRQEANSYPASLLEWCRNNHVLLRHHVFSVVGYAPLFTVTGDMQDDLLTEELTELLLQPEYAEAMKYVVSPSVSAKERRQSIGSAVRCAFMDIINASNINGNLAYIDRAGSVVYAAIVNLVRESVRPSEKVESGARLLKTLYLPAIDDVSDLEFVAIRMQSDEFEEYRSALGRVLVKTEVAIEAGKDANEAFRDNLDEIYIRADQLRREIKDQTVNKHMRAALQGVQLSAVVSTAAAMSSELIQGAIHPASLIARFLTSLGLASLFSVVTHKSPLGRQRMLRFYEVLLSAKSSTKQEND